MSTDHTRMGQTRFVVQQGTCVFQAAHPAFPASSQAESFNEISRMNFHPSCSDFRLRQESTIRQRTSVRLKSPWTSHTPAEGSSSFKFDYFVGNACGTPSACQPRRQRVEAAASLPLSPGASTHPSPTGAQGGSARQHEVTCCPDHVSASPASPCADPSAPITTTTTTTSSIADVAAPSTSALQRAALLHLLGPSTNPAHVTGYTLLAGITTALVQRGDPWPHSPHPVWQPQPQGGHLEGSSEQASQQLARGHAVRLPGGSSSSDNHGMAVRGAPLVLSDGSGGVLGTAAAAVMHPGGCQSPPHHAPSPSVAAVLSPLQLHAACLASVAAALVRLPQVWSEPGPGGAQVTGLPGLLVHRLLRLDNVGFVAQQQQQQLPHPPPSHQPGTALVGVRTDFAGADGGAVAGAGAGIGGGSTVAGGATCQAPSSDRVDWLARFGFGPRHRRSPRVLEPASAPASAVGNAGAGMLDSRTAMLAGAVATQGQAPVMVPGAGSAAAAVRSGSGGDSAAAVASGNAAVAAATTTKDGTGARGEERAEAERPKAFENPIRYAQLLFAGAMSAVVSRTCVAPLERVKMDLLLRNGSRDALSTALQVLRTEGIAGFWKGNALNVLRTAPFKAVNFFSFDMYHSMLLALVGMDGNFERFAAGACAGVTATLVCFPLDLVRTRLLASVAGPRYGTGPFSTLVGILRNEGAAALYAGCLPAVIGMAPAGAVFYGVYDMLKHRHLEGLAATAAAADGDAPAAAAAAQSLTIAPVYTLLYGAMAGAASELIVYPLEVIRRKMQLQSMALAGMRQVGAAAAGAINHHHTHHVAAAAAGAAASAAATAGATSAAAAAAGAGATAVAATTTAAAGVAIAATAAAAAGTASTAATAAAAAAGTASTAATAAAAVATAAAATTAAVHHGATAAGAGGCLAAAAAAHHLKPQLLVPQPLPHKALMTLSAAAVANSPGLARVAAAVTAILRADGPRGFYSGLLPNMLQVLPSAALSYYTYDTLKTALGAR